MAKSKYSPSNDIPNLNGKVYLITGGTAGLGAGTVKYLAAHNPEHIYFTGRSTEKANALIESIHKELPDAKITFIECDLISMQSVKQAAGQFLKQSQRLDVLMCNAGIMCVDANCSSDGYEIQFSVNHLSHALLIELLLPTLKNTASQPHADVRIVNMTSTAYEQAPKVGIHFPTLKSSQPSLGTAIVPGHKWSRYGQSKLANMLYPQELAKRYPEIMCVSVHPGVVQTDIFNVPWHIKAPALILNRSQIRSVEEGPYNQVWAATCQRCDLKSGEFYVPIGKVGQRTTESSRNEHLAEELYDWTQEAIKNFV